MPKTIRITGASLAISKKLIDWLNVPIISSIPTAISTCHGDRPHPAALRPLRRNRRHRIARRLWISWRLYRRLLCRTKLCRCCFQSIFCVFSCGHFRFRSQIIHDVPPGILQNLLFLSAFFPGSADIRQGR